MMLALFETLVFSKLSIVVFAAKTSMTTLKRGLSSILNLLTELFRLVAAIPIVSPFYFCRVWIWMF
jgi:hypothetical protein